MTTSGLAKRLQLSPVRLRALLVTVRPPGARRTKGGHWRFRDPAAYPSLRDWIDEMQPGRPLRAEVCGRQAWKELVTEGMTRAEAGTASRRLKPLLLRADIIRDGGLTEYEFDMLKRNGKVPSTVGTGQRMQFQNTLDLRKWLHRMRTNPGAKKALLARISASRAAIRKAHPRAMNWTAEIMRHSGGIAVQVAKAGREVGQLNNLQRFALLRSLQPARDLLAVLDKAEQADKTRPRMPFRSRA